MYMFPKFLEALPAYYAKMKRDSLFQVKYGHSMLLALTMGITSFVYNQDPGSIKNSILFLLDLVIGRCCQPLQEVSKASRSIEDHQNQPKDEEYQKADPQQIEQLDDDEEGANYPEKESDIEQGLLIMADSAEM